MRTSVLDKHYEAIRRAHAGRQNAIVWPVHICVGVPGVGESLAIRLIRAQLHDVDCR